HVAGTPDLRALVLVTLDAGVDLVDGLELRPHRHVAHHRVAVGAGHFARLVRAALPIEAVALVVAGEANRVVVRHRAAGIVLAERDDAADAAPAARLGVERTRAVAGFAAALLLRVARIAEDAAH